MLSSLGCGPCVHGCGSAVHLGVDRPATCFGYIVKTAWHRLCTYVRHVYPNVRYVLLRFPRHVRNPRGKPERARLAGSAQSLVNLPPTPGSTMFAQIVSSLTMPDPSEEACPPTLKRPVSRCISTRPQGQKTDLRRFTVDCVTVLAYSQNHAERIVRT